MCNLREITIALKDVRQIVYILLRSSTRCTRQRHYSELEHARQQQHILNASISISRNESVVNTSCEDYRALSQRNHDIGSTTILTQWYAMYAYNASQRITLIPTQSISNIRGINERESELMRDRENYSRNEIKWNFAN